MKKTPIFAVIVLIRPDSTKGYEMILFRNYRIRRLERRLVGLQAKRLSYAWEKPDLNEQIAIAEFDLAWMRGTLAIELGERRGK